MAPTFIAAPTIFEILCRPLGEMVGEQKQDSFTQNSNRLVVEVVVGADINQIIASTGEVLCEEGAELSINTGTELEWKVMEGFPDKVMGELRSDAWLGLSETEPEVSSPGSGYGWYR